MASPPLREDEKPMSTESLFDGIQRRRLPHWLVAYAAAAWGCTEATGFLIDNYGVPQRALDVVLYLLIVLLFVVLVLAWYHGERGPQRPTRVEAFLLGLLVCIGVVGSVSIARAGARPDGSVPSEIVVADLGEGSLAVLPFYNTAEGGGLRWLDRGIAELLSTNLAQVGALRVVSSQRVLDLAGQLGIDVDGGIRAGVASTLIEASGARLAVTGSIYGRPGDLTIAATLADATTGEIRASARARGSDVLALVDEIAAGLSGAIGTGAEGLELTPISTLTTGDIDAYRAYDEGRRASQRYLLAEAAEHFGRALEIDSTFALARFRRALSLYQLGLVSEAAKEARRARAELGRASERDRLFVEAFDHFSTDTTAAVATVHELRRKYPDDKDARIIFAGMLATLRGDADPEARAMLLETLELDPSYAPAYNILAYSYAGSGDLEAADSLSRRYVELEPDEPNAWDTRGEILELAGDLDAAREAFWQALRIRPDFRVAINHVARLHLQQGDPVEARRELAPLRASSLPDVRVRAQALEADSYLWEGRIDRAVAAYAAAEREAEEEGLTGLRAWRLRDLVQIRLALGQQAAAMEAAETLRTLEPLDGWWITTLFESLVRAGDAEQLERMKPQILAQLEENPLTVNRVPAISRLIDLWIAYVREDHAAVVRLASELPDGMQTGVLTDWPVIQSMLELGQTEEVLGAVREYAYPRLFARGPRFQPLRVRWAQYFEARAHEAAGDTTAAVADYRSLVRGLGDGLTRFPTLADVPERLEALTGTDGGQGIRHPGPT